MRPAREEQRAPHVHLFLAVSAVYLGLAEPTGADLDAAHDDPGSALPDELGDAGCRCRAA
jgi:hypothetical protein